MARIVLIHWNEPEAKERAARLRNAGHSVTTYSREGGAGLRDFDRRPPDAFVIDLGRLPSHGRAAATYLRQRKATRAVPLVFVDGAGEKVAATRKLIPDAEYTDWRRIRGAIARALRRGSSNPVVPDTMRGYSGTPLPKKLTIRPGDTLALLNAPEGIDETIGALPEGVTVRRRAAGKADVIVLFTQSLGDLKRRWPAASKALAEGGRLWVSWPKKASGVATDLTQASVRGHGLKHGLVDFKICAIDATWSGLCFARRRGG